MSMQLINGSYSQHAPSTVSYCWQQIIHHQYSAHLVRFKVSAILPESFGKSRQGNIAKFPESFQKINICYFRSIWLHPWVLSVLQLLLISSHSFSVLSFDILIMRRQLYISNASSRSTSHFWSVRDSLPYIATLHTDAFTSLQTDWSTQGLFSCHIPTNAIWRFTLHSLLQSSVTTLPTSNFQLPT